jgi:hypothetical protein
VLVCKDDSIATEARGWLGDRSGADQSLPARNGKDLRTGLREGATEFREMRDDLLKSEGVVLRHALASTF